MKSNYRRIGDFISQVKTKNTDGACDDLLGVNLDKKFMKSVANLNGVDLTKYTVIKKGQFGCKLMSVGRDKALPISLLRDKEKAIISSAYYVFEVIDEGLLDSEYLMMWFLRPDSDRYLWFQSGGDIRGRITWEEFCGLPIKVPSIEKQRAIVAEYNTVVNRIKLNEQLNEKLEQTAQALYKHWFVDFGYPIEAAIAARLGVPKGSPYKSSGGKMVYNEELEKEIPEGWEVGKLGDLMSFGNGKTRPKSKGTFPVYGGNGIIEYINEFNQEDVIAIGRVGAYCGSLYRVTDRCWISDNAIYAKTIVNSNMYCFYLLKSLSLNERSEGTGQPLITQGLLNSIVVEKPSNYLFKEFEKLIRILNGYQTMKDKELKALVKLDSLLLAKMTKVEEEKLEVVR